MKGKAKHFIIVLAALLTAALAAVPAYADIISSPIERVIFSVGPVLLALIIVIFVISVIAGIILLIIFSVRKKKRRAAEEQKDKI